VLISTAMSLRLARVRVPWCHGHELISRFELKKDDEAEWWYWSAC